MPICAAPNLFAVRAGVPLIAANARPAIGGKLGTVHHVDSVAVAISAVSSAGVQMRCRAQRL
jgi:hypothetical protein